MLAARAGPRPEEEEEASELGRRGSRLLVRALGRLEQLRYGEPDPRTEFEDRLERKFPAFRGLHLREVLPTHAGGKRFIGALPEAGGELIAHDVVLSETIARGTRRACGGPNAPARTIPQQLDNGFSCGEYRAAACQGQTIKSHPFHKKTSPVP